MYIGHLIALCLVTHYYFIIQMISIRIQIRIINVYFPLQTQSVSGTSVWRPVPSCHFLLKILSTCYLYCRIFSGIIKTKARIDYESIKQIYVNAFVTDTGVPQLTSTAEIIVDIINTNDNDPVFTSPEYRFKIAENSPKGAYVGNIDAKDNDDGKFILFSV